MDTNSNSQNNTGILLLGHGSRLPFNKEVVYSIAEQYKEINPDYPVEVGFMELAQPDIPAAFNKLKETGVNRIIVTPVFLAHGMHTKRDIPTILGLEVDKESLPEPLEQNHEHHDHDHDHDHEHHHHHHHHHHGEVETVEFDGEIIYTEPLGADSKIVEIVAERINEHL